jgi:hypothetical protein
METYNIHNHLPPTIIALGCFRVYHNEELIGMEKNKSHMRSSVCIRTHAFFFIRILLNPFPFCFLGDQSFWI